jgi:cobalt/nickel transport system ATP-binding protein
MENRSERNKIRNAISTIDTDAMVFNVEQVCFSYDKSQIALDQVNLNIRTADCAVILGANGSGKSTLLKLLDGLYFPQSGAIRAFGSLLSEQAFQNDEFNYAFRRKVGLVFQDSDVQLFSPSVLDEVAFAPLQLGLSRQEVNQRVDEALHALNIEKLRERAPHRLSGGEKRKVAIASVLSLRPQVWLLDEPTAGLDPRSQSWLVDFILEQHRDGKTVIVATHDLSIVEHIATWVYVFNEEHRLAASGSPEDILHDHALLHACNLAHTHLPPHR